MCGRFSFSLSAEKIRHQLDVEAGIIPEPNYNIAPTQEALVITNEDPGQLQFFRWGLIPFWAKDASFGARMINARSETIASKPAFRNSFKKKRCLVPADSFYEWEKRGKQKIPYRIHLKSSELMLMAGLWDTWNDDGKLIHSFTIITAPANKEVAPLHDRMPLILTEKTQQENWLDDIPSEALKKVMDRPPDDILEMYRVSEKVNSVRNNSPGLHNKFEEPPSLF